MIHISEKIRIYTKSTGYVPAEIDSEKNPITAKAILEALPIRGNVNRWGDEVYFSIPISLKEENSQQEVEVGELGYWPPGQGFCIFFGKTPASKSSKPRAASPINVFGKIVGNATIFRKTKNREEILIEKGLNMKDAKVVE